MKRQLSIHADAAAQGVHAAAKELNLAADDLEMIMSLPTESATRVLNAHGKAGGTNAGRQFLHKLVMMRWNALFQGICYQSKPESFIAGFRFTVPETWQECRDEYSYQSNRMRQTMHPKSTDLAKLWRSGKFHTPETPLPNLPG